MMTMESIKMANSAMVNFFFMGRYFWVCFLVMKFLIIYLHNYLQLYNTINFNLVVI